MKKKSDWVDVHNDALMIQLGIRQPARVSRDSSVWTKTLKEKALLRKLKSQNKSSFKGQWSKEPQHIPVYDKCILTLKPNKEYRMFDNTLKRDIPKTTISIKCAQSDIPNLIAKYKKYLIKYHWNGKDYLPNQIPYWMW